ncbi:alpha-adaptin [Artemisia annua]|uniref:Alpha-adaptin n=1 Tax=Artemisia annua TaxID=35608 RepID=A0A2U1KMI8_ARTAN|nr:alpha-adaptin [Artemisia annua]
MPCYAWPVRIETDPADRTQLRMTVTSGDPALTFEHPSAAAAMPQAAPAPPIASSDPGALLAGLL